jgi:hypothetical protein
MTHPFQGSIEAAFEFHVRALWPEGFAQFLPGHDLTGAIQQKLEDPKRLILQLDPLALSGKGSACDIGLEQTESIDPLARYFLHVLLP